MHLPQWLEAQSLGLTTEAEVRMISAHVARWRACRALLANDDKIRRRLALLRIGEPRMDVLGQVLQRLDQPGVD